MTLPALFLSVSLASDIDEADLNRFVQKATDLRNPTKVALQHAHDGEPHLAMSRAS